VSGKTGEKERYSTLKPFHIPRGKNRYARPLRTNEARTLKEEGANYPRATGLEVRKLYSVGKLLYRSLRETNGSEIDKVRGTHFRFGRVALIRVHQSS